MVSLGILAALGGLSAVGATAVATGDASAAIGVVHAALPSGLNIALSHVPSWTHAHEVLTQHLSAYATNGQFGAGGAAGTGAAVKNALAQGMAHTR